MREIFVFGSNLAGRHGAGAALYARNHHGAIYGQGVGPQGDSYAIPTKDERLRPLPLDQIKFHVNVFLVYARQEQNADVIFNVTAIGTGFAGYSHEQIAPFFRDAPKSCRLPGPWIAILARSS